MGFARSVSYCGAGLAELGRDVVQVLLRFLLTAGESFEEVCFRGRQGFRNQGHGLHTLLKHFGFLQCTLDGFVENRLIKLLCLLLPSARLSGCFHGLVGGVAPLSLMRLARCAFSVSASGR